MTIEKLFNNIEINQKEQMSNSDVVNVKINICNKLAEIKFQTLKQSQLMKPFLSGLIVETDEEPEILIYYWSEDYRIFLEKEQVETEVWRFKSDDKFAIINNGEVTAADYGQKKYYMCIPKDDSYNENNNHVLILIFMFIFRAYGYYVVHGASTGYNGYGSLITARGGKGKSTLSVSCLLDDFEFVADDYTVLKKENGQLYSFPLYKTVGLNQDMYKLLKPDMPIVHTDTTRNNKLLLDASSYKYKEKLPVKCLIVPKVSDVKKPEILPANPGSAIIPLIHSTVYQMTFSRNVEIVKELSSLVSDLPVYEFLLTSDIILNREYFKKWLLEKSKLN